MNILFTVWGMSYGGAERFVLNLVKSLDKRKYNVIVFSDNQKKGPLEEEFRDAGAKVVYSKYHRFKHPTKYIKQLRRVINEEDIDIIHANDDLNMVFPLIAKPKETKFVAHSHSTIFRFTGNKALSAIARRVIPPFITKHSDRRLSCGIEAGKAMFGKHGYTVIQNGVNLEDFKYSSKNRNELRKEYGIVGDDIVLFSVGRLSKEKNHTFMIDIYKYYREINGKSKLIIVGDGSERQNLEDRIKEMGLSNDVLLLPASGDVAPFYSMADVFLLTSVFEGMPMVAIEAQANGLKCVFSEVITRETNLLGTVEYLPLSVGAKEWAKAIFDLDFRRIKSDNKKLRKFDARRSAAEVEKEYSDILNDK